jgi:hypothetical protein
MPQVELRLNPARNFYLNLDLSIEWLFTLKEGLNGGWWSARDLAMNSI